MQYTMCAVSACDVTVILSRFSLGKTIQVISFLCGLFDSQEAKTVLIVMPLSLIENWKREFEKW